ncbi:MAG TPA: 2-oxoacid ferredoxin oxidoreductase [Candidatus Atribacteria bacterium]|nr:2-oxoacid ferredoxin oxidoreductase [Candidatus Atribacteria bacterium]
MSPFRNQIEIAWCPGCGNFNLLTDLSEALSELGLKPSQVVLVSGIGQAAKAPHYIQANVFNGLHGRSIPVAFGIQAVNPELTVIAESGDGCMYGEGGNHLIHAIRRNPNITVIVHDNQVYGLTKGQASPTSETDFVSKTQPLGTVSESFHPIALAISQDVSFVARGFTGDKEGLKSIFKQAIQWKGFSLVDVLQPCVTFNRINTFGWYRDRVYPLPEEYDPEDQVSAFKKSLEWGDKIPLGVIYRHVKSVFSDRIFEKLGRKDFLNPTSNYQTVFEDEKPGFE